MTPDKRMSQRLDRLQKHLALENPTLVSVVNHYRALDEVAITLGLLKQTESYATQISWWPLISILGTFSAGKSSFINSFLGANLQKTGNQAVDDRFTVITYSSDAKVRTLPGIALDNDPRFPFYQISEQIERVSEGEGAKIDSYLQMKAVPSPQLKGKIIIDSPGFDADEQRKSTLKLTDHIIDLSDLVLVFFDARHPEPGAMQDTLEHLVKGAQRRNDSSKFLFILNQIDTSAKENNLEDIIAAWHKALVQTGLSSGRFYVLFNKHLAIPVKNKTVWDRYVAKRDTDYARIMKRMADIDTERVYRIVGSMESLVNQIEQQAIPQIRQAKQLWRKRVISFDITIAILLLVGSMFIAYNLGLLSAMPAPFVLLGVSGVLLSTFFFSHFWLKKRVAASIAKKLSKNESYGNIQHAFLKSTGFFNSVFFSNPSGWGKQTMERMNVIHYDIDRLVQGLNDKFTRPSGE
ncbi:MAG: dynamin family protein [Cocleimonas sp.]|nr:dynamin family protein [Cocleimonas sp.]